MLVNFNGEIIPVEDFDELKQIVQDLEKRPLAWTVEPMELGYNASTNSPLPLSATDFNFVRLTMDDYI